VMQGWVDVGCMAPHPLQAICLTSTHQKTSMLSLSVYMSMFAYHTMLLLLNIWMLAALGH
jgi:hypothetical protein